MARFSPVRARVVRGRRRAKRGGRVAVAARREHRVDPRALRAILGRARGRARGGVHGVSTVVFAEDGEPLRVEAKPALGGFVREVNHLQKVSSGEALVQREESGLVALGVVDERGELDVQVCAEPVPRSKRAHEFLGGGRAEGTVADLVGEELFLSEEGGEVAVVGDAAGPIVRQEHVHGLANSLELVDVELSDVVRGLDLVAAVGWALVMARAVVVGLEDAAQAAHAQVAEVDHPAVSEVVDVRAHPSTVIQLP